MKLARLAAAAALAMLWPVGAFAQDYPSKPIRLIIPLQAGSAADLIGREYCEGLSKILGQPVVPDNKPGAGGNIGAELAKDAAGDGYTILFGSSATHASNSALYPTLPFDPVKDFVPVSRVYNAGMLLSAAPAYAGKSLAEIVADAKARPGAINVAVSSSSARVVLQAFSDAAGIELTPIPYKSSPEALKDVMAGEVDLLMDTVIATLSAVKGQQIRPVAVSTVERMQALPDVPTFAEGGVGPVDVTPWGASFVPAGTPMEIVDRLSEASRQLGGDPAHRAKIASMGGEAASSTSEELSGFVTEQTEAWGALIRKLGLTAG